MTRTPSDDDRHAFEKGVEVLRHLGLSRRAALAAGTGVLGWMLDPHPKALAQGVTIDITRARADPIPIAIVDLQAPGDANAARFARDIPAVITANLQRSGLFRPLNRQAFLAADAPPDRPRFADWRAIGASHVVTGRVLPGTGGELRVEYRLWDVAANVEGQMTGSALSTAVTNWRALAHTISDVVYERILGEKGYFNTRIAYISESGPRDRRIRRLALMDQDGENHRFLTDGLHLVLTPRFHPTQQQVAFLSYASRQPRVYLMDLDTTRQTLLGNFPGMSFAPRFSPDGSRIVLSTTRGGSTNIVLYDLGSRREVALTNTGAIDTSPGFSPDGRQIAFNSDRGGSPQIYVMEADGSNPRRISFGQGRYTAPVWSPRGDLIAFIRQSREAFGIGVMRTDGTGERILTESYLVDGPTFAPNGRVIAFFRESPARDARGSGFSVRLSTVDVTGFNERQLSTPADGSDPAWSPLVA